MSTEECPEEAPEIVKIFVNNCDLYQGTAICKALTCANSVANPTKVYEINGSFSSRFDNTNITLKSYYGTITNEILSRNWTSYYIEIFNADYIIFDIGENLEQLNECERFLEFIVERSIEMDKNNEDWCGKHLIVVSTPLTWAATKQSEVLIEDDYRKRRPHPRYMKHKCLEKEIMNFQKKMQGRIKTLIVCPGFTYGGINEVFHYIFKLGFYNKEIIPIPEPGIQHLPIIYINDFAQMIKSIIDEFPTKQYVLACELNSIKLKHFTRGIVNNIAGSIMKTRIVKKEELLLYDKNIMTQYTIDAILSDIKMAPCHFESFPFSITGNIFEILVKEYREERNLLPIKILIDGPPCIGKTTIAQLIVKNYKLQYIEASEVVGVVKNSLEKDIAEAVDFLNYMGNEKCKLIEIVPDAEALTTEEAAVKDIEDNTQDVIDQLNIQLTEIKEFLVKDDNEPEIIFNINKKCLIDILSSKQFNENQGYIIDGFPFVYHEAADIFGDPNSGNEEEGENDENAEDITNTPTYRPDFIFILDAADDLLCRRAKEYTEAEAIQHHCTECEFFCRLEDYRDRNNEDTSISSYFYDCCIIPINLCVTIASKIDELYTVMRNEIGQPHIYPFTRCEKIRAYKDDELKREKEKQAEELARKELQKVIKQEREQKLREWTQVFERLKREEEMVLEIKSLPLRNYLSKYVLPILTEGLLQTVQLKPKDPIDFLAEYLFKCNKTGKILSNRHVADLKRILLMDGKEGLIDILKTEVDDETDFSCGKMKPCCIDLNSVETKAAFRRVASKIGGHDGRIEESSFDQYEE